jgi:hypothetical protein
MTARETTVIVKDAIDSLGGGFMISPEARRASKDLGLRGWELYFAGRAGVLGDTNADAVAATLAFFPPDLVRSRWESARGKVRLENAVAGFTNASHRWGRHRLGGFDRAARLADLMAKVVREADIVGLPLFAAWARLPLPDDPPARLVRSAHLLSEHRCGLHAIAVLATGLSPLDAIVAGPYGAENARFFQWAEPYPRLDEPLRRRRAAAEELTDDLVCPAYGGLTEAEAAEFVDLIADAQRAAFSTAG